MSDDDVRAGIGKIAGLLSVECIRRRQQVQLMRGGDAFHLQAKAHSRFFQILAEGTVDQAYCGEVLNTGEAEVPETPANTGVCCTTGKTSDASSFTI